MGMVSSVPFFDSAATATPVTVSRNPAVLSWAELQNPNNADVYVQWFDARSGDVVLGTTAPVISLIIPANGAQDKTFKLPPRFNTALSYAVITTATGSGAPATPCVVQGGFSGASSS